MTVPMDLNNSSSWSGTISPETAPQFIKAARAGSEEAMGRLLSSFRSYLRHVAKRELGKDLRAKIDPSDLIQDTLFEAQRDFKNFESETYSRLKLWLTELLRNNVLDAHRRYRVTAMRSVAREQQLDSRVIVLAALYAELREKQQRFDPESAVGKLASALDALPEDYRRVLQMRHGEGMTFAEIGRELGKSESAAAKLHKRAARQLKLKSGLADEPQ